MISERVTFADDKYSGDGERFQPYKRKMLEMANKDRKGRILDIGCGSGRASNIFDAEGWKVIGIDVSRKGITQYRRRGLQGLVADAEQQLPFASESFDAVWISEVIEHIVNYRSLIKEIGRVLKPYGRVYLTTPNSAFYGYRLLYLIGRCPSELQHPYHLRFFSPRFLSKIFRESGFNIEKQMGQNIYLWIPGSVKRFVERVAGRSSAMIFKLLGLKKVDGLIHGEKLLRFSFSTFFNSFFSNAIMVVASKSPVFNHAANPTGAKVFFPKFMPDMDCAYCVRPERADRRWSNSSLRGPEGEPLTTQMSLCVSRLPQGCPYLSEDGRKKMKLGR